MKFDLLDKAEEGASVIQSLGTISTIKDLNSSAETQTLTFTASKNTGKTVYLRMTMTGALGGAMFKNTYSDFQIIKGSVTSPTISEQPVDTINVDDLSKTYTLSVNATGENLNYKWQYQLTGGTKWIDITDATERQYTISSDILNGDEGNIKLHCVVSNAGGSVISNETALEYSYTREISSKVDLDNFIKEINQGRSKINAKLTADIGSESEPIRDRIGPASSYPFSGFFDGQGHTLYVNLYYYLGIGLFGYADGATIKNLTIKGKINASRQFAGGLIGITQGKPVTISNCVVADSIISTVNGDGSHGGLVGLAKAPVSIDNCVFVGDISGKYTTCCGGFIGWADTRGSMVKNSLQAGTFNINEDEGDSYTIARNPDNVFIYNTYFVNQLGRQDDWEIPIHKDWLATGEMITMLQGFQKEPAWAQRLGVDTIPTPFDVNKMGDDNYVYRDNDGLKARNFVFNDGTFTPLEIGLTAQKVVMKRSMTKDQCYTLALPYDWTADSEDKVYTLSTNAEKEGVVYFMEVEDKNLEANKPYLIVPCKDITELSASDVSIAPIPLLGESTTAFGANFNACLAGMSNESAVAAQAYILQADQKWHPVTAESTNGLIAPYRAYLTFETPQHAKSLAMVLSDGTATAIRNIGLRNADGTVRYYDLSGRYVGTSLEGMPNGVYISNNKKIVK